MDSLNKLPILLLLFSIVLTSCQDDDKSPAMSVSTGEAADEVATTLTTDVVGITEDILVMIEVSTEENEGGRIMACGFAYDTTITKSYEGIYSSFNHSISYGYELVCDGPQPQSLGFTFESNGSIESTRISTSGNSEGTFNATGIEFSSASYIANGLIERSGTLVQKTGLQRSFSSAAVFELTDLTVNKSTLLIESGIATVNLSGLSGNGETFQYTATVTFNGDKTATITFNNSESYRVDLETGQVTMI